MYQISKHRKYLKIPSVTVPTFYDEMKMMMMMMMGSGLIKTIEAEYLKIIFYVIFNHIKNFKFCILFIFTLNKYCFKKQVYFHWHVRVYFKWCQINSNLSRFHCQSCFLFSRGR